MLRFTSVRFITLAIAIFNVFTSQAIVIRHDVDEKKYMASWQDFPPLAQFYIDGAHGILIEPSWIVTAAHTTFCTVPGSPILVGGKKATVKRLYVHPGHTPGVSHDIALMELASPITDIKPARIYKDDDETGEILTFIGAGGTGTGIEGQTIDNYENAGVLRKAQNTVDRANGPLLEFVFHRGENALPLEGIGGGGDSGGPAFIQQGDDYLVFGVSSRGEFGSTIGKYGNREYYSRLSYFKNWIDDVIAGAIMEPNDKLKAIALPKLKHLMPGLTEQNLPEICSDIQIQP